MMTGFDYFVLVVMGFSVLLSMMRGLTQEILSLLSWVLTLWCASQYADKVSRILTMQNMSPEAKILMAFVGLLIVVWLATLLIRLTAGKFIQMTGLGGIDRILGVAFGFVRGSAIVLVIVLIAGMTTFPQLPMWRHAVLSPIFESAAIATLPWLPPALAKKIHY